MDLAANKEQACQLLDRLAPEQLAAVLNLLKVMAPASICSKLSAIPLEDEEISEAEEIAVAEAVDWLAHNKPIPNEEVIAEFGLTTEDFRNLGETPLPPNTSRNG